MQERTYLTKVTVAKQQNCFSHILKYILKQFVKLLQQVKVRNVIVNRFANSVLQMYKLTNLTTSVFHTTFSFT